MRPDTPSIGCPYHAAAKHFDMLHKQFGVNHDLPLFPDSQGDEVTDDAMLKLIEWNAMRTGEDVVDYEGRNSYVKHSWRSTGAVYLTGAVGIEVVKVQLFSRWASPIITHYTRLAPLRSLAEGVKSKSVAMH